MMPELVRVITSWFNEFAVDEKMAPEGLAKFIHSCTADFCKPTDRRVKILFQ